MGFLCELGYGSDQNFEEVAVWYFFTAQNGNQLALKRMGILMFLGGGVIKDEKLGILLILLGSHDDLLQDFNLEEQAKIKKLRDLWTEIQFKSRRVSSVARNYNHRRINGFSNQQQKVLKTLQGIM